jgi:hypothetical protein
MAVKCQPLGQWDWWLLSGLAQYEKLEAEVFYKQAGIWK